MKPEKYKVEKFLDDLLVGIYVQQSPKLLRKYELYLNKFEQEGYRMVEYREILDELKGEYL